MQMQAISSHTLQEYTFPFNNKIMCKIWYPLQGSHGSFMDELSLLYSTGYASFKHNSWSIWSDARRSTNFFESSFRQNSSWVTYTYVNPTSRRKCKRVVSRCAIPYNFLRPITRCFVFVPPEIGATKPIADGTNFIFRYPTIYVAAS